jgi:hypothetical protein
LQGSVGWLPQTLLSMRFDHAGCLSAFSSDR